MGAERWPARCKAVTSQMTGTPHRAAGCILPLWTLVDAHAPSLFLSTLTPSLCPCPRPFLCRCTHPFLCRCPHSVCPCPQPACPRPHSQCVHAHTLSVSMLTLSVCPCSHSQCVHAHTLSVSMLTETSPFCRQHCLRAEALTSVQAGSCYCAPSHKRMTPCAQLDMMYTRMSAHR